MAVSLTLVAATPHSLKYKFVYDGIGGAGSGAIIRTQAQILADFAGVPGPSPLKALLAATVLNADWLALNESPKLSVYTNITVMVASSTAVKAALEPVVPDGNVLSVIAKDGDGHSAIVELRYHHTIDR